MPNRLIEETSPYLLQHAHNPVDWYPWGDEALQKARSENKPIFLSIGYAACHWCHVMEHESFENPEIATLLNRYFVSIKVDREERPDIDNIYMGAVTAMTGSGGWPMSLFLTPEGRPFYGGTYFPPARRYGMPSFKEVLMGVVRSWGEGKGEIYRVADKLTSHLQESTAWSAAPGAALNPETLSRAAGELLRTYNHAAGGWGQAPLFPQPMSIEFLLLQSTRGNPAALETALHSLRAMNRGGMYDLVGGGFHRYSTDDSWLVPHFEKMLYDNAQLALAYLHAYLLSRDEDLLYTSTDSLDFIRRELTHPEGGFYSSLDADSEGEEGKFYVWTQDEMRAALADPRLFDLAQKVYTFSPEGNYEGKIILQRRKNLPELAGELNLSAADLRAQLGEIHARLRKVRSTRMRPATDDKILVSWNALALQAFAQAARYLERPDYLETAQNNAAFLLDKLYQDGRLKRAWRNGQARHAAFLEDYAGLILGLLDLYQADANQRWFAAASRLAHEMVAAFADERGGFYSTRHDQGELILRPKEMQDGATPAGNSLAAYALLALAEYTGQAEWFERAEQMLSGMQAISVQYPAAFGMWLQAMDFAVGPVRQVAVVYPGGTGQPEEMIRCLWQSFRPRTIAAISSLPVDPDAPALLQDRPAKGRATAYVCESFICRLPVSNVEGLASQLAGETG